MSVFDADTFSKNDLIGMFQFDMLSCYYKKNHEIHNQWVGINDPLNEKDKGLQGYMKLSIAVLGPGDKLKVSSTALCTLHLSRVWTHLIHFCVCARVPDS